MKLSGSGNILLGESINFFDQVMVNSEVAELKQARLNLINWIRSLFLSVADVSHLSA